MHWTEPSFGYASLIKTGDRLLILTTEGELVLVEATARKYAELARARVSESTCRALPALAGGRLYVRDTEAVECYDLRPAE